MYVEIPLEIDLLITNTRNEYNHAMRLQLNAFTYFNFMKSYKTDV